MKELNIEDCKQKINDYFDNVTPEQLHQDLIDCGLGLYVGEEYNFLDKLVINNGKKTIRKKKK